MACIYDPTLQDDCVTPVSAGCYDIEGASVPCGTTGAVGSGQGYSLAPSTPVTSPTNNPVASAAATSNGSSSLSGIFSSLLNFGSTIAKDVTQPSTTTGLILRVNPANGQQQYYNPATGTYVGSPVSSAASLFGGNSFILIIVALVVAFFAFGGLKRKPA